MTIDYPEGCTANPSLIRLHELEIIDPFNFTGCLPQCGICEHSLTEPGYVLYNLILIGGILPLIGCFGLIGNALSAFVYSRPEMSNSTNIYLAALGCSDSAVIATGIFLFFLDSIRKFSLRLTRLFGAFSPIIYPLGLTAQSLSVFFTVCAGADCFAQVCLPSTVKHMTSRPFFVKRTIICVVIFSVIYNIPHCLESLVIDCYHTGFHGMSMEVCPDPIRYNELFVTIYYNYMYSIFLAVGPLIILVILNTMIICASIFGTGGASAGDNISLVLVVLLFIACNVAALLLNTLEPTILELIGSKINYIVDLSNVLVVFNSSFNFVIYVSFSKSFSNTLKKYVFRRGKEKEYEVRVVVEKQARAKINKERLSRMLIASQPEVLI